MSSKRVLSQTAKEIRNPTKKMTASTSHATHQPQNFTATHYYSESCSGFDTVDQILDTPLTSAVDSDALLNAGVSAMDLQLFRAVEKFERDEEIMAVKIRLNEHYRLLDTVELPVTKTTTKFLTIGVKPLDNSCVIMRLANLDLTSGAWFTRIEAVEFFNTLDKIDKNPIRVKTDTVIGSLQKYIIMLHANQTISFSTCRTDDVYKPLYLSLETVRTVLLLKDLALELLKNKEDKKYSFNAFEEFVDEIATQILNSSFRLSYEECLNKTLHETKNNLYLYEIALKLPYSVKHHTAKKLEEYGDNTW